MLISRHLTLTRCPGGAKSANCTSAPIDRPAYLKNALTLLSRRHARAFYAGYVSCEDPACGRRTRALPLRLRGAFPVCCACERAVMTKEVADRQLYRQMLFYQQLFDVDRAANR